jgi:hypothetical protein
MRMTSISNNIGRENLQVDDTFWRVDEDHRTLTCCNIALWRASVHHRT